MMYRTKLAAALASLLILILFLGAMLIYGVNRVDYYFQRSQQANEELEQYLRLSSAVDRFFYQRMTALSFHHKPQTIANDPSYLQMITELQSINNMIEEELRFVDPDEYDEEAQELLRILSIEQSIDVGIARLNGLTNQHGELENGVIGLQQGFLQHQFRPLIDEAIADEQAEVREAEAKQVTLIQNLLTTTLLVSCTAVFGALILGNWLFRRLRFPLDTLLRGTQVIGSGDLSYRIPVIGHDEFSHLAIQFNAMADVLQQHREELNASRLLLEGEVLQRTKELREANEQLQQQEDLRRQFFADVSHELRTPLTIIRGEAEVTLRSQSSSYQDYHAALNRIIELSAQMAHLVDDLLFLARSDVDKDDLVHLSKIILNDIVAEAYEDALVLAHHTNLRVTDALTDDPLYVQGDRQRLLQLLHILLDNALRYSPDGGELSLRLYRQEKEAIIEIQDTGIGIDDDDLDHVFERHYRSQHARKLVGSGAGLGLPLAKSIVDSHHGSIRLTSQLGQGTCVRVQLPIQVKANKT